MNHSSPWFLSFCLKQNRFLFFSNIFLKTLNQILLDGWMCFFAKNNFFLHIFHQMEISCQNCQIFFNNMDWVGGDFGWLLHKMTNLTIYVAIGFEQPFICLDGLYYYISYIYFFILNKEFEYVSFEFNYIYVKETSR